MSWICSFTDRVCADSGPHTGVSYGKERRFRQLPGGRATGSQDLATFTDGCVWTDYGDLNQVSVSFASAGWHEPKVPSRNDKVLEGRDRAPSQGRKGVQL